MVTCSFVTNNDVQLFCIPETTVQMNICKQRRKLTALNLWLEA